MPMTPIPAKLPPSNLAVDEARVPAMLRVRDGTLIGIEDQSGNVLGLPVTAKVSSDGGLGKLSSGGKRDAYLPDDTPIICIGGDHPYSQWWGTNGRNGMAQAYLDRGIKPYIAVNTQDDGPGSDAELFMTWEQVQALSDRGVEMIAHGHRHIMRHNRCNTGIRIRSTNADTNTVNVTTTGVVLSDTPNGTTTLLFATYPTIGQLVAAINAVPGWISANDPGDVFDADPSSRLLPLKAARTVTASSGTQRFAMGGGFTIAYTGTAYQDVRVRITQGTFHNFELYADGVRLLNYDLGNALYNTLTKLVTVIRGSGVAGLTLWLCDNGREQTGADFPSYLQGDEDSYYLSTFEWGVSIMGGETRFDMCDGTRGITGAEILRRNYDLNKATAAANGIDLKNYAVSGYHLFPRMLRGNSQFASWRGTVDALVTNPMWQWSDTFQPGFRLYWTAYQPQYANVNRSLAVLEAIADSGPTMTDLLIHKIQPDGSSGYTFQDGGDPTYFDQTEAAFLPIIDKLKALQDAGKVRVMSPDEARQAACALQKPRNRIFNPRFRNSGESIKAADNGLIMPGWSIDFSAASVSAASAADGVVSYTTTSAVALNVISQAAWLKPGRTYEVGFYVNIAGGATGSGVRVTAQSVRGLIRNINPSGSTIGGVYRLTPGLVTLRFTVPRQPEYYPGRIIGKGGPFDLSTNKNVRLNLNFLGQVSVDCSAGAANPAAVTAKEVAAAINAAIAATPAYTPEYHNIARAIGTKVQIENPYAGAYPNYLIDLAAGASADASTTIFGGIGSGMTEYAPAHGEAWPWWIRLQSNVAGSVSVRDPYIQEIDLA